MDLPSRSVLVTVGVGVALGIAPGASVAGSVVGKVDLPPAPARKGPATHGFLDRVDNPLAAVRPVNPAPYLVIVLEGGDKPAAPAQVTWDLVGESFAHPVIAVAAGTDVVIKNSSHTARTLTAAEAPGLIPAGALNPPPGTKPFKAGAVGAVYTIGDKDAPHLSGRVIVVAGPYNTSPDDSGKFELPDVPEGTYKLRLYYRDGWLDRTDETVVVPAKGKVEINPKVPAGYPTAAAKK